MTLRNKPSTFQKLVDSVGSGAMLLDVLPKSSFRFVAINELHAQDLGISQSEIAGKLPEQVLDPSWAVFVTDNCRRCVSTGSIVRADFRAGQSDRSREFAYWLVPLLEKDRIVQIFGTAIENSDGILNPSIDFILDGGPQAHEQVRARTEVGTWEHDLSSDSTIWCEETRKILGRTGEADPGFDEFLDLVHPDDRIRVAEVIDSAKSQGNPYDIEFRINHPRGEVRFVNSRGQIVRDIQGNPERLVGTLVDINDQRKAENDASRGQFLLKGVFDAVPAWLYVKDSKGRLVLANRKMLLDTGMSEQELRGMPPTKAHWLNESQSEEVSEIDRRVIENGESVHLPERHHLLPNGEDEYFHQVKLPLRNALGEIIGLVGVNIPQTEQVKAQRQLQDSHQLLQTIFDALDLWIWVIDRDRNILLANQSFLKAWNLPEGQLEKVNMSSLALPDEIKEKAAIRDKNVMATGQRYENYDSRLPMPNGEIQYRHIARVPLHDGAQNIIGVVATGSNLTPIRQAEDKQRRSEELLHAVVGKAPIILWAINNFGFITLSEGMGLQRQGLKSGALVGSSVFEVYKDHPEFLENVRSCLNGESINAINETRGVVYERWFEPITGPDNIITGLVGVSIDVTERVHAEVELQASQQMLQATFDALPLSVYVKDTNSRFLLGNETMLKNRGISPDELSQLDTENMPWVTSEQKKKFIEIDKQVFESGYRVDVPQLPVNTPDGGIRYFHQIKVPLKDNTGRVTGLVGVSEDITDRIQAEQEIKDNQILLQTVIDTIPHSLHVKDQDLRYRLANKTFANNRNLTQEEFIGRRTEDIPFAEKNEISQGNLSDSAVISTEQPLLFHEQWITDAKGRRYVRISKLPLKNEDGICIGLVAISEDITDKKNAEEDLKASQLLLQTVIDAIPGTLAVKDKNGVYLNVNPAWCVFNDRRPEDVLGKTISDISTKPKHEIDNIIKQDRNILESDKSFLIFDHTGTRSDGSEANIHSIKAQLKDEHGEVTGLVALGIDVTEQVQAQEALRVSEERLRLFMDSATEAFIMLDSDLKIIDINRRGQERIGLTKEQLAGNTIIDIYPDKSVSNRYSIYKEIIRSQQKKEFNQIINSPTLGRRNVHFQVFPLGSGLGVIGTDLTDRVAAENEIRAQQHLLETVFESIPIWIFVKDSTGKYIMVNKAMIEDTGMAREGFEAKGWMTDEQRGKMLAADREVLEYGRRIEISEREIGLPGGAEPKLFNVIKTPLLDAENNVTGMVGIAQDVTEQRMTETQLRHALKLEAIGQLAGGVAHDFNNLLQVIQGYTQRALISLRGEKGHNIEKDLGRVLQAAESAASVTGQLLTFSRRQVVKFSTLDVNEVISSSAKMLTRLIGDDIVLEFVPGENLKLIEGDKSMLEQIVMNLSINARDAMSAGGKLIIETKMFRADRLFCSKNEWASPGNYVTVSVSDMGAGIPPEILEQIFEPFFTTKDVGEGSGLGLSVVHGIVKQHRGHITVYSELDIGSTFRVYLPASESQEIDDTQSEDAPIGNGGSETILIAEDDPEVLELVSSSLQEIGYTVLSAMNGVEACKVFDEHSHSIDLALLDVVMPEMRGRAVYEHIRSINPDIPILFATGYTRQAVDSEFLAKNHVELLHKPYSFAYLFQIIRKALDR